MVPPHESDDQPDAESTPLRRILDNLHDETPADADRESTRPTSPPYGRNEVAKVHEAMNAHGVTQPDEASTCHERVFV